MEVWKDIPGIPFYQASSLGKIRSLTRIIRMRGRWGWMQRTFEGRNLAACQNSHGYLQVSVGNPAKCFVVHDLVARAFHGCRDGKLQVNHRDGDKDNNRPENLEYVTSTENNHHALGSGLRVAKILDDQLEEIRSLHGTMSLRAIGRKYGIHHSYVRYLLDGRRKAVCAGASRQGYGGE